MFTSQIALEILHPSSFIPVTNLVVTVTSKVLFICPSNIEYSVRTCNIWNDLLSRLLHSICTTISPSQIPPFDFISITIPLSYGDWRCSCIRICILNVPVIIKHYRRKKRKRFLQPTRMKERWMCTTRKRFIHTRNLGGYAKWMYPYFPEIRA